MKGLKLSVIIVNYNTHELLCKCVDSINKYPPCCDYEIIVADNASTDGSALYVKSLGGILLSENVGFAKANNICFKKATGDYILMLNPDTQVTEGSLTKCLNKLICTPEAGVLGCRLITASGELDLACRRSLPTLWNSFCRFSRLSAIFKNSRIFAGYNLTYLDEKGTYFVGAVVGAFMLFKKSLLDEIGMLDESFFMYGEDLEFCRRVQEHGKKIIYFGQEFIYHHKRASSKKSQKAHYEFYNAMKIYYNKYSNNKFMQRLVGLAVDILFKAGKKND